MSLTRSYSLNTVLDCGDLGQLHAIVEGKVTRHGLGGHLSSNVTAVFVAAVFKSDLNVQGYLTRAARTDLEEKLEREFERDVHDPRGGDDDFGRAG